MRMSQLISLKTKMSCDQSMLPVRKQSAFTNWHSGHNLPWLKDAMLQPMRVRG
jgi:hypothetical protein